MCSARGIASRAVLGLRAELRQWVSSSHPRSGEGRGRFGDGLDLLLLLLRPLPRVALQRWMT